MLFSESDRQSKQDEEKQYGYINLPVLRDHVRPHTYEELIFEYKENNECNAYIAEFYNAPENTLEDIDYYVLLNDTFDGKRYAEILKLDGFYINFEPEINSYNVLIDKLES